MRVLSYWVHQVDGGVARLTEGGWHVWVRGKGWSYFPDGNDISQGKTMDWDQISAEEAENAIAAFEERWANTRSE